MGDIATTDRCDRFISEFNQDAIAKYGLNASWVKSQGLGLHEGWKEVHLYFLLDIGDGEVEVMLVSPIFFAADECEDDLVERVVELFEIDEETARERLRRTEVL
jgi:hypothetical protein